MMYIYMFESLHFYSYQNIKGIRKIEDAAALYL